MTVSIILVIAACWAAMLAAWTKDDARATRHWLMALFFLAMAFMGRMVST